MKSFLSLSVVTLVLLVSGCSSQMDQKMSSSGAMMHDMTSQMQVSSDEEFIAKMIPHHEEAVLSSRNLLETSKNEELRTIAQNIIDAQQKEIADMKKWSTEWFGKDVTDHHQYMQMMPKLTGLSSQELDRAYMTGMIAHHQGAIDMARDVMKFTKKPELQQMARNIIGTQQKEIDEFKALVSSK